MLPDLYCERYSIPELPWGWAWHPLQPRYRSHILCDIVCAYIIRYRLYTFVHTFIPPYTTTCYKVEFCPIPQSGSCWNLVHLVSCWNIYGIALISGKPIRLIIFSNTINPIITLVSPPLFLLIHVYIKCIF